MRLLTKRKKEKITDQSILEGLKSKDSWVFNHLYEVHSKMIIGHVKKNSGSDEDAKEVLQITFVKLWLAVKEERYQHQGKMAQYIFQLAANSWKEELRRRRNQPTLSFELQVADKEDDWSTVHNEKMLKDKQLDEMHQAIEQLGSDCQKIIKLYHLKLIRLKELAHQFGYNYNNLRKRIFDCRKKLKKIMSTQSNFNTYSNEERTIRI